jgi:hypothetical protein
MPAQGVVRLPDDIAFDTAAGMMLKGLTAQYLLKKTLPVQGLQPGDHVLFHAAAGGVGLIACQWAKALGLQLIGTAGSAAKCQLALDHGAAHVIDYRSEDFVAASRRSPAAGREGGLRLGGQGHLRRQPGLPAALRPAGQLRQRQRARCRRLPLAMLGAKGSLYVTRQTLFTHIATREATQAMADELFAVVQRRGEDPHRPALRAGRRGAGAPRPGSAQDHRQHGVGGPERVRLCQLRAQRRLRARPAASRRGPCRPCPRARRWRGGRSRCPSRAGAGPRAGACRCRRAIAPKSRKGCATSPSAGAASRRATSSCDSTTGSAPGAAGGRCRPSTAGLPQHLLVEEEQRRQRLVVRGGRDLALVRQPGQEGLDLGRATARPGGAARGSG